jgi:hypothetical protein
MISFPTYRMATGIAERAIRRRELTIIIPGLVSQTSRKNRGRLPRAFTRSFQLKGRTAGAV